MKTTTLIIVICLITNIVNGQKLTSYNNDTWGFISKVPNANEEDKTERFQIYINDNLKGYFENNKYVNRKGEVKAVINSTTITDNKGEILGYIEQNGANYNIYKYSYFFTNSNGFKTNVTLKEYTNWTQFGPKDYNNGYSKEKYLAGSIDYQGQVFNEDGKIIGSAGGVRIEYMVIIYFFLIWDL